MRGEAASLLSGDAQARIDALEVTRSFIVQAPAGSGKTELLIQRYLRLLAHVEQPEEVLAITFTRKAAQEMRMRAAAAMRDAERGVAAAEPHQAVTLEAAFEVLERDREKNWRLLESPRRMRVETLDAFNAGIARALPFSSGLGNAGNVVTDEELDALYRAAASATLDWLLTRGEEDHALERVLEHVDNNIDVYISYIARMLAKRDQWMPLTGSGLGQPAAGADVRKTLEKNIAVEIEARLARLRRLVPERHTELLVQLARYAAGNLQADHAAKVLPGCGGELPDAVADQLDAWRAICNLLLTKDGSWRKTVNKNDGFPPGDAGEKQQMLELLREFDAYSQLCAELHRTRQLPNPHYSDTQWEILLALFRLLPLAVAELRRLFSERGVTDHTEIAIAAAAALGSVDDPGDTALLLDYSIRHLLIDEMQDTSISQYRLIEQLVAGWEPGDGRTLFCVGDPMQSIYRFRDAEVGQFLLARTGGIGPVALEPLVLRRNFRSGERLVQWFNEVFAQILPAQDDVSAGAIAYSASLPVGGRGEPGEYRIYPLFDASYEEEADRTVDVIRRCLDTSPEHSTAVLVRSRTHLPLLLARLREADIDYQAVEIDRLTDLPEITDVLALTRALAHHGDRGAWLGLLRGPWAGLDWTDLHSLVFGERSRTVWELLHDVERLQELSLSARAIIETFRERIAPFVVGSGAASLRDCVEQAWYALDGPFLLHDQGEVEHVYRFFDVIEGLDTAGTVCDVAELESRLDRERVSGRAASGCSLQIMTMHKAKGLQFDHVVIYGLGRTAKGDEKSILSWLNLPDGDGGTSMIISPVGARAEPEDDALHNFVEATERDKGKLEQDRLLYVACTRARYSVNLIGHVALSSSGDGLRAPREGSLLHRLWPTVESVFQDAWASRGMAAGSGGMEPALPCLRMPVLRRLKPGLSRALPVAPGEGLGEREDAGGEAPVNFDWVGSIARQAGTIVHDWLQRIAAGDLHIEVGELERLLPPGRNRALELGVPLCDVEPVCTRAIEALRNTLEDPRGRWVLSGPGAAELPVTGLWNGKVESVVIDRVRIDAGVHWIIDYKTSSHEGGDLSVFVAEEVRRYRQQLMKYACLYRGLPAAPPAAIRTALYFPLLREFREVQVDAWSAGR